ncbi:DUF2800 domain-containing protein [Psychrobacter pygoscelis]|uniref:DUF2800 domain-containing protein n=1 Tax=Psychrobacter pygoscelis TaxID=2488563 RepID=UPI00103EC1C1|nr:DUF2800 domain-containing protein [Psychrobacter pygoscelis]
MATHAKLSPSSAVRWLSCPAAPLMERGKPNTANSYAAEGTAAHHLADQCLSFGYSPSDKVSKVLAVSSKGIGFFKHDQPNKKDIAFEYEVDQDMADYVQEYIDLIDNIMAAAKAEGFFEQALPLESITGEKGATGTADAVLITDKEIIVIDLKYGQGNQVDAERNPQLMMYGLAALNEFDVLAEIESVRLIISQPRRQHVSEWTISADELKAWGETVSNTAKLIDSLDETSDLTDLFAPSEDACRYCKASAECKAYAEHVHRTVCADFEDLDAPLTVDDAKYDGDTLAKMFERIGLIKEWIKAVEQATVDKLYAGESVGDFKLVQSRGGRRKWLDEEQAEATLKAMRLKVDDMYNKKLISPTDAEKLKKAGTLGDIQWNKLQDLIVKPAGNPTIAPGSDKREAIITNPVEMFDDLTEA